MQHITSIGSLAKQLKDRGEPVPEIDIVNKIICCLVFETLCRYGTAGTKTKKRRAYSKPQELKTKRTNKGFNNGRSDPADEAFFSSHYQPTSYDRTHRTIEEFNVVTRGH